MFPTPKESSRSPRNLLRDRRREAIEQLTRYLREHYGKDAKAEVVDEVPLSEKGADPLLVVRFYAD